MYGRAVTIMITTMLLGCAGSSAAPSEEKATDGPSIATSFEASLVGPLLDEVRSGVRPFDDEGIGLCAGETVCERFLGREVSTPLEAGEYGLFASLRVPPIGEPGTWTVQVDTTCKGNDGAEVPYNRSYDVVAPAGRTPRPFRLLLQRVTSPDPAGPRTCTWKVTAPHPDREIAFSGSWSTR